MTACSGFAVRRCASSSSTIAGRRWMRGFSGRIVEVEGDVDSSLKDSSDYVVQLPPSECSDELVLTPPLAPEAIIKFSKRNVQRMQENIETKAIRLAQKRDLGGLQQEEGLKELRSGAEMVRSSIVRLMKMCEAVRRPIEGE
ncbi:uncharacterized protein [Aegilops tauschii subsp. strangulata]|uniref:uncharacterized protein isoform X1 n=1 Tax=Aegilops tauschii subsp. strangulata TaxID=200361 RepID=UPI001ABBE5F4